MKLPIGDIIRAIAKPGSWLTRIFGLTKGISINVKGIEILLDDKGNPLSRPSSTLGRPHRPGSFPR